MPVHIVEHGLPLTPRLILWALDDGCSRRNGGLRHSVDVIDSEADRNTRIPGRGWSFVQLQLNSVAGLEHGHAGHLVLPGKAKGLFVKETGTTETFH